MKDEAYTVGKAERIVRRIAKWGIGCSDRLCEGCPLNPGERGECLAGTIESVCKIVVFMIDHREGASDTNTKSKTAPKKEVEE
jgi:hypothetical protein